MGERYILGNRNYTLDRLSPTSRGSPGVEPPALRLPPAAALRAGAGGGGGIARARPDQRAGGAPGKPVVDLQNTKAKRELGWQPSPHEETLEATVEWYRERRATASSARGALAAACSTRSRRRRGRELRRRRRGGSWPWGSDAGGPMKKRRSRSSSRGGASRGAYQAGCLKRLEEEGIVPDLVVGSSIGVCNSLVYATGGRGGARGASGRAPSRCRRSSTSRSAATRCSATRSSRWAGCSASSSRRSTSRSASTRTPS